MKNNLFKKFLSYFYGSGIGLIIGILTTILSTRILSPEDFGKASMFTLFVNLFMIFIIFGTDQAFVRFYYEEKKEFRNKLLFNTMKIPVILLGIVLINLLIFRDNIMMFLFNETNNFIFTLIIISISFQMINRFALLIIRMQQKGHLYSLIEIFNKLLNLILLFIFYYLIGSTYEILVYSTGVTIVMLSVFAILLEKKYWSPFNKAQGKVKHSQKDILRFSYPLVLTTIITWLFQSFDTIAIRQWSNFEQLGLYSAAFRIVALLTVVQSTFSTFWSPVCYEHFEKYPQDKYFFAMTSRIIAFIMFTIAIIIILSKDLIVFLLGPEFREAAIIMPFLIFMPIMYTLSETTVIGLNFYKKTKWHILIAGLACLANILGNFLLVPTYGAAGAAISTGLSYILFFILRTHLSIKYYSVDYGLKRIYTLILCISLFALQNMIWVQNKITNLIGIALLLLVGFFYKSELQDLISGFQSRKKSNYYKR